MESLGKIAARVMEGNGNSSSEMIDKGDMPKDCLKFFPEHPEIIISTNFRDLLTVNFNGKWIVNYIGDDFTRETVHSTMESVALYIKYHLLDDIETSSAEITIGEAHRFLEEELYINEIREILYIQSTTICKDLIDK